MTLIAAIVTPKFVLVGSDRRVSQIVSDPHVPGKARVESFLDSDTKLVVLDGRIILGFAGLARIRIPEIDVVTGKPMRLRLESWIVDVLGSADPSDYVDIICQKFATVCQGQGFQGDHSFLLAGWPTVIPKSLPNIIEINNQTAAHSFYPYSEQLNGREYLLRFAGSNVPAQSEARLRGILERTLGRYGDNPIHYIAAVRRLFVEVSEASRGLVGDDCLITTMPVASLPVAPGIIFDLDLPGFADHYLRMVSRYYPNDPRKSSEQFGPAMVSPTMSTWGGAMVLGTSEPLGPLEGSAMPDQQLIAPGVLGTADQIVSP